MLWDALLLLHPQLLAQAAEREFHQDKSPRFPPPNFPQISPPRRVLWRRMLRTVAVFLHSVHYFHYRRVWKSPNPAQPLLVLRVTAPTGRDGPCQANLARARAKMKVGGETRVS